MSSAVKWVIALLVVVAAVWLLWYSGWVKLPLGQSTDQSAAINQAATSTANATPQAAPTNGMSAQNDASDAGLAQDAAAIDAQAQGLSSDASNIDASLNDKPVTQAY